MELAIVVVLFCAGGFGLEALAGYLLRLSTSRAGLVMSVFCTFLGYASFGLAAAVMLLRMTGHGPLVLSLLSDILHPFR